MNPHAVFLEARKRGLQIVAAGDKLAIMPKGACPPDFAAVLLAHKPELLAWLTSPPCPGWQAVPPDDLPLVPVELRPTAEVREAVIAFLARQCGDWRNPGPLCMWLVCRENSYFDGPGLQWDCAAFSYAAGRDAACWQLNCPEAYLLDTLASFEAAATKDKP